MRQKLLATVLCSPLLTLVSCSESPDSQGLTNTAAPQIASSNTVQTFSLVRVIDGDTVVVVLDGEQVRVRLVGIDTPEVGECGFEEAARALESILASGKLGLVDAGVDDRDRFDRLLRYLDVDGIDPGLELIRGGFADAAYDSRTGFKRHNREELYIAADTLPPKSC